MAAGSTIQTTCFPPCSGDLATFDGYVFEALRFRPAFTYFIRLCDKADVPYDPSWSRGQVILEMYEHLLEERTGDICI